MRIVNRCVFGFIAASVSAFAGARDLPPDQPPIWSTKPDVNAFEKIENDRLDAAQRSIGKIVAVKGPKTIGNTLANYDEALPGRPRNSTPKHVEAAAGAPILLACQANSAPLPQG